MFIMFLSFSNSISWTGVSHDNILPTIKTPSPIRRLLNTDFVLVHSFNSLPLLASLLACMPPLHILLVRGTWSLSYLHFTLLTSWTKLLGYGLDWDQCWASLCFLCWWTLSLHDRTRGQKIVFAHKLRRRRRRTVIVLTAMLSNRPRLCGNKNPIVISGGSKSNWPSLYDTFVMSILWLTTTMRRRRRRECEEKEWMNEWASGSRRMELINK